MAKSSLQSGRQFRSVQRISSAMAESSITTHPEDDPDEPEEVEEAAGEALDLLSALPDGKI